jgi:hypothetical protein
VKPEAYDAVLLLGTRGGWDDLVEKKGKSGKGKGKGQEEVKKEEDGAADEKPAEVKKESKQGRKRSSMAESEAVKAERQERSESSPLTEPGDHIPAESPRRSKRAKK